jgi:hypothetical protein
VNYGKYTNAELLRHADLAQNDLTDLERELLGRLEAQVEENILNAGAIEVLEEFDIDTCTTKGLEHLRDGLQFFADFPEGRALLEVLQAQDIYDFKVLAKKLERLDKFDQVMEDLTDPLTTLQSLVTTE